MTQKELKQLMQYDADTGVLRWRHLNGLRKSGLGSINKVSGCLQFNIKGKTYKVHRLIWLYMTGEWPTKQIDHINRNRADNRWGNLRLANNSENNCNKGPLSNNKSGLKGVHRRRGRPGWCAVIYKNKTRYRLGTFNSPEAASAAYADASGVLHGEFARTG